MAALDGDPSEEGRVACEKGVPRGDCPYDLDSPDYHAWIEGWDEAEEARLVAGEEGPAGGAAPPA